LRERKRGGALGVVQQKKRALKGQARRQRTLERPQDASGGGGLFSPLTPALSPLRGEGDQYLFPYVLNPPLAPPPLGRPLRHPDVPKLHHRMMVVVLQADVAFGESVRIVLEHLFAIDGYLNVASATFDADLIPFARRP